MLPKRRRLNAEQVREVIAKGRTIRGTLLSVRFLAAHTPLQTAVVVSKAVAKKAVMRNRLRRAVYRALIPLSGAGRAVVFVQKIPKPPLTPAFATELLPLLKKNI